MSILSSLQKVCSAVEIDDCCLVGWMLSLQTALSGLQQDCKILIFKVFKGLSTALSIKERNIVLQKGRW